MYKIYTQSYHFTGTWHLANETHTAHIFYAEYSNQTLKTGTVDSNKDMTDKLL